MTTSAGMRALAITLASALRAAATNGTAHVFSYTSSAAVVPGSITPPASARSSSLSNPERAPAKVAKPPRESAETSFRSTPTKEPSASLRMTSKS